MWIIPTLSLSAYLEKTDLSPLMQTWEADDCVYSSSQVFFKLTVLISLLVASLIPSGVKSKSIRLHEAGAGFSIHYQGKAYNSFRTETTAVMGVFEQVFDAS